MPTKKHYPVQFILRNLEVREDGKVYWRKDHECKISNPHICDTPAGSDMGSGYAMIGIQNKNYAAHRIAWILHYGSSPKAGVKIRHKDGDKTNNKKDNLVATSRKEISRKNSKRNPTNTSGYKGVYWDAFHERWIARIVVDGENKYLGSYTDKDAAIAARYNAETKYGFAHQE